MKPVILVWLLLVLPSATRGAGIESAASAGTVSRVLFLGDSITVGVGVQNRATERYSTAATRLLQARYPGCIEVNLGRSGQALCQQAADYAEGVLQQSPDAVVIQWGVNDHYWGYSVAQFSARYEQLVAALRTARPSMPIVAATLIADFRLPENQDQWIAEANVAIQEIAARYDCQVADLHFALAHDRSFYSDQIHPNAAGAAKMAEVIAAAFAAPLRAKRSVRFDRGDEIRFLQNVFRPTWPADSPAWIRISDLSAQGMRIETSVRLQVRTAPQYSAGVYQVTVRDKAGAMVASAPAEVSDATIVKATPFARDPMVELRAACRKYGLKFGFYYSHAFDWGEENGPGNDWDFDNPGGDKTRHQPAWWTVRADFLPKARRYVDEKSIPQLRELIHNYDPDILWFDTPHKLPPEENLRILAAVRQAKPSLVVNGRLVRGAGDYLNTADRPAEFAPQAGDWEGIPTTNESYGYNAHDLSHKPAAHFIRLLAKAAARGGNTLLNIGPMGNGRFDPIDVTILQEIGTWWRVNGESIRGTERTPLAVQAWGESTRRGNRLYLHVFDWPADGQLVIGGLKTEVVRSYLLSARDQPLAIARSALDVTLTVPKTAPDASSAVVVVECAAEPRAESTRLLSRRVAADTLRVFDARLEGNLRFGPGKKTDDVAFNWKTQEDAVVWPVRLNEPLTFVVEINYDAPRGVPQTTLVEGDAGQETVKASPGAGGIYRFSVDGQEVTRPVVQGTALQETLGKITLTAGHHELRIAAQAITGEELFRLRSITLKPVNKP